MITFVDVPVDAISQQGLLRGTGGGTACGRDPCIVDVLPIVTWHLESTFRTRPVTMPSNVTVKCRPRTQRRWVWTR